ncbi:MAG: SDR family NAD(P)-dependent oxidoreductase, partial [Psychrobacter sp.]
MQHKLLNLVTKSAKQSKAQVFSAVQPSRYLKDLNKQQVGQGKTVLITGASSGLGEGMARLFAKLGYNLAICARRTDRLERLQSELVAAYPNIRVEYQALDVSDY